MPTIKITRGTTQVDLLDCEWAVAHRWHISDTGYARTRPLPGRKAQQRMHRLILSRALRRPLAVTENVDHINGDKLDNRRSNLRLATKSQNGMNLKPRGGQSRYTGVGKAKDGRRKCWMTYINVEGTRWYMGKFYDEMEAAWMRDQYAIALHGEFARLNFDYVEVPTQAHESALLLGESGACA